MRAITLAAIIISAIALLGLSACSSSKKTSTVVATKTVATKSTPAPTSAAAATKAPTAPSSTSLGKLTGVEITNAGDHDHLVFTFGTSVATPHVDSPTASPTYCASGEAVPVTGQYLLEVRFSSATAHNGDGTPSVAQTSMAAGLPAVLQADQTCDFEGTVTWLIQIRSSTPVQRSKDAGTTHTVDVTHP